MDDLYEYQKAALKLAETVDLGPAEGHVARIPGFRGLLAVGRNSEEALEEMDSALTAWMHLAIERDIGLPELTTRPKGTA